SVCGWLRIAIAGADRKISSVSLRGNNGEILAGDIVIDANSAEYTLDNGGSTANKITLKCGDGLALQYAPVYLHIGVLPQTFSKGITVEVKYTDGRTTKLNTTSAMTIARNHIVPMECVDSEGNPISSSVPNNQIWYSATGHVDFENGNYGEVRCISNQFDETTGTGVAIFSASIKSINSIGGRGDNLKSLMLPKSLQSICTESFAYCSQLTHIELNEGLEVIGDNAFAFCTQLEQVRIPESVIEIGTNPFARCESISEFKGKHTSYDGGCLMMNDRLIAIAPKASETYTLPDNIREIGSYCLVGRSDITELTLPSGLERISDYAFSGASTLNRIYCKSQTPPAIGNKVFASTTQIYVPMDSLDEYEANNWDIYDLYGYDYTTGEIKSGWESLGMGIYVDDFYRVLMAAAGTDLKAGYAAPIEFKRNYTNPNRIRVINPAGRDIFYNMFGGVPGFLVYPNEEYSYIEFDVTDPNNVKLAQNPAMLNVGINFADYGVLPACLYVTESGAGDGSYAAPITYVDGKIIFPKDGVAMGYMIDGEVNGWLANTSGLMSYYLPGAEYANCEMSVEYEGLSEPTNGGAGKAVFTFQTSADGASFKFAFVAGNVTDDPSEVVDAI
ncbi:MAG: leucine-rich repeat domain-containing protein, partial [Alistipes sp.]|nr:leucine-rich repeat domain-containing protein [Alistipes sp.]